MTIAFTLCRVQELTSKKKSALAVFRFDTIRGMHVLPPSPRKQKRDCRADRVGGVTK